MKLICEAEQPFREYDIILEQQNEKFPKQLKIKGPMVATEIKNANGRVYSRKLMETVVDKYNTEKIITGLSLGELSHPNHTSIDYNRISHRISSLKQDESNPNIWIGEAIVASKSPCGQILESLIMCGAKPGMSTRGIGTISEGNLVKDEYVLVAIDCVSDPSGPGCFVNGILESKNYMITNFGEIVEQTFEKLEKGLATIPSHSTHTDIGKAYVENLIQNFLNNI